MNTPDASWVEHPDLVEFYSSQRNTPDDLYPSERRFLPWLAGEADTVLDVGCGAGGFAAIWDHFHPGIAYTGVDASAALVGAARRLHPEARFEQADGSRPLPFADRSFDVVAGLGWLHLEPRYRDALPELWRVAGRRLFFDVRLQTEQPADVTGRQRLALSGDWDGATEIPYIAVAWAGFAQALLALGPASIRAHGYTGAPADTVSRMPVPVCFATFVLERSDAAADEPDVLLDLPFPWPAGLPGRVAPLTGPEPPA